MVALYPHAMTDDERAIPASRLKAPFIEVAHPSGRQALLARLRDQVAHLERPLLEADPDRPSILPLGIGPIDHLLPGGGLALNGVHEMVGGDAVETAPNPVDEVAALFFTSHLAARRAQLLGSGSQHGAVLWIGRRLIPHAPGLKRSGLNPETTIFVKVPDDETALWAMEEALKCPALSAAVAEVRRVGLTASRRLQLAAESHGVTGFLLRPAYSQLANSAAHSRWRIISAPSGPWSIDGTLGRSLDGDAGQGKADYSVTQPHHGTALERALGPERYQVDLVRTRNGARGSWTLEWRGGEASHMEADRSDQTGRAERISKVGEGQLGDQWGSPSENFRNQEGHYASTSPPTRFEYANQSIDPTRDTPILQPALPTLEAGAFHLVSPLVGGSSATDGEDVTSPTAGSVANFEPPNFEPLEINPSDGAQTLEGKSIGDESVGSRKTGT